MTNSIHDTSIKVDVYPDEFKVLLKAINRAIDNKEGCLTDNEVDMLRNFKDDFTALALEHEV
jgi:hypothetical protein